MFEEYEYWMFQPLLPLTIWKTENERGYRWEEWCLTGSPPGSLFEPSLKVGLKRMRLFLSFSRFFNRQWKSVLHLLPAPGTIPTAGDSC